MLAYFVSEGDYDEFLKVILVSVFVADHSRKKAPYLSETKAFT